MPISDLWPKILSLELKINANLFGSLLAYSYLCSVRMKVLATPLSAGSKTEPPLLHFKSLLWEAFIFRTSYEKYG